MMPVLISKGLVVRFLNLNFNPCKIKFSSSSSLTLCVLTSLQHTLPSTLQTKPGISVAPARAQFVSQLTPASDTGHSRSGAGVVVVVVEVVVVVAEDDPESPKGQIAAWLTVIKTLKSKPFTEKIELSF